MWRNQLAIPVVVAALAGVPAGCGSGSTGGSAALASQAQSTVAAVNAIAEEVAKNPSNPDILSELEAITANSFDAAAHPAETKQIIDTYNTRIKGKLKGEAADRLKNFVDSLQQQAGKGSK